MTGSWSLAAGELVKSADEPPKSARGPPKSAQGVFICLRRQSSHPIFFVRLISFLIFFIVQPPMIGQKAKPHPPGWSKQNPNSGQSKIFHVSASLGPGATQDRPTGAQVCSRGAWERQRFAYECTRAVQELPKSRSRASQERPRKYRMASNGLPRLSETAQCNQVLQERRHDPKIILPNRRSTSSGRCFEFTFARRGSRVRSVPCDPKDR